MEQLLKDLKAGQRKAKTKYDGKRVELTGKVLDPSPPVGFYLWSPGGTSGGIRVLLRTSDRNKLEGMRAVSRSQSMVVRGKVAVSEIEGHAEITDAEIVRVGPSPAVPATVAEILAEFDKPEGQKKFTEVPYDIVLRAEIHGHGKTKEGFRTMLVSDPGKPEPTVKAQLHIVEEMKAWSELKPGTVVILMAKGGVRFVGEKETPHLSSARVLTAPPDGVMLPEAGKK
jgi:hypothetical protein